MTEDLYVATELNSMESLAGSEEGQALFYVGHSGWGPGQLETELAEGSWLVLPATAQHVFGDHDTIRSLERNHDRSRPATGPVRHSDQTRPRQSQGQLTEARMNSVRSPGDDHSAAGTFQADLMWSRMRVITGERSSLAVSASIK